VTPASGSRRTSPHNTTYIYPFIGNPGYNLITAMADEAIGYMNQVNTLTPDQPFFVYYVPGGTLAPHHPTPEWIKKISDLHLFDEGWNKLRETIFANQKKLGVIPQDAKLTPWPKDLLKEWDQLTADEKKMFIRRVDVFAAYVAYTDHENLDIGSDTGSPVDDKDYQVPFAFTGKINKITLTIDRPKLTPEDEKKLMQAKRNNRESE